MLFSSHECIHMCTTVDDFFIGVLCRLARAQLAYRRAHFHGWKQVPDIRHLVEIIETICPVHTIQWSISEIATLQDFIILTPLIGSSLPGPVEL